jgi:small subunit ribosomal protein S18
MAKKQKRKPKRIIPTNLTSPFSSPDEIDYKDVYKLKKFVTTRGRIIEAIRTGMKKNCQRKLALSIKRARYMALLPFNEYA